MDLKPLPSSLRKRRRYIIVDIISESEKSLGSVVNVVWDSIMDLLGEIGTAKAGVWVVKDLFDEEKQRFGVKVNHDYTEKIRASIALVNEIEGEKTNLRVLGITGTMKSARAKYFD